MNVQTATINVLSSLASFIATGFYNSDPGASSPGSLPIMVDAPNSKAGSYVVVARRYRPQSFDALIGQEHVARALQGAITADRVGHAYLFTGARGVGKTSAARILAKALNCGSGPTPTPCNECDLCHSITSGEDIDVLEIDGASNRGIDEIRQLRQNAAVRPSRCRYKIYIIDEVHMLTKEAFNALLKTLEEPPEHVKFIFATTEPQKVPITILSRCQRFDFAGISTQAIEARLADISETEGVEVEPEALAILARRAAGSMRDGQSLLEQLLAVGGDKVTTEAVTNLLGIATNARIGQMADQLLSRNAAEALAELDAAVAEGTDVGMLLEQLLGFFRDAMVLAVGGSDEQMRFAMPSQAEQIREASKQSGIETLLAVMQVLDQAVGRMRMSVDVRTLAEMALVRISRLEDLDDLAGAIAELRGHPAAPSARGGAKKNGRTTASRPRVGRTVTQAATATEQAVTEQAVTEHAVTEHAVTEHAVTEHAVTEHAVTEQAVTEQAVQTPIVFTPAASTSPTLSPNEGGEREPDMVSPQRAISWTAENVDDVWRQAVGMVGGMLEGNAALASRVEASGQNCLVVTFDEKYTACKEFCEQPDHQGRLVAALAQVAGQSIQLTMVLEKAGATKARTPDARKSRREVRREISAHPFVQHAAELFGADTEQLKYTPPETS